MTNSFDTDSRGPSNRRLFVAGVCFLTVITSVIALCLMKSQGRLDNIVRVTAELMNVGDGLPAKSDVKFRGVLVGEVSDVELSGVGRPYIVRINLKPNHASSIPDTVTARVVPSNVFAVSSVQLVSNGLDLSPLRSGSVIREDHTLPTVLFQSLLTKVRELLKSVSRDDNDNTIGVLAALSGAAESRGSSIRAAGSDLHHIVTQLNNVVGDNNDPTTISALATAANALRQAEPVLSDALDEAIAPMRALTETRSQLTNLISAGINTTTTLGEAFDNHTDRLIAITTQLTPVIGTLADNSDEFTPIATRMTRMAERVEANYDTERHNYVIKAIVSLAPFRQYVRADCPRYGELEGPSCQTAPEVPTAPDLLPALGSMGIPPPNGITENRPNLAPPRDSVRHAGDVPGGIPPSAHPTPGLPISDPGSSLAPTEASAPETVITTPSDKPEEASSETFGLPQNYEQEYGGSVGPVGSVAENSQLSQVVGREADSAVQLLLGPVLRGAAVHITPDTGR